MDTNWKRRITLFLATQTISLFGTALVQYAITWHITLTTQSGSMMTIAIVCGFLPTFFLSPFGGVWADRYNRKRLIIISDSAIALTTLVMALLFLAGHESLWLLFVMSAVRALGSAVQGPAVGAILPQLVPEDQLTRVNGINGSIQALIMLVAPMASGALLGIAPLSTIFFIDVVTCLIAVCSLFLFLQVKDHERMQNRQEGGYFGDLREGIRFIATHSYLKQFFIFGGIFFVLMAPAAVLTPLQVARSFGDQVWRLVAIEITFSVGMMLGGLLIATWGGFRNKIHSMTLSCLIMGACTAALGVVPDFWIYLGFMSIFGLAIPLFNTPSTVLLQDRVDKDYTGRVFGVFGMISSSMMPMGMLVFGPMADRVAIEWILLATGVLLMIQSLFLLKNKALLKAGAPLEPGPEAKTEAAPQ
ncbi:MAG: transporter [Paenibacillaceae bacterium]|nr:transporter [Paenibacillaceae bacterium]